MKGEHKYDMKCEFERLRSVAGFLYHTKGRCKTSCRVQTKEKKEEKKGMGFF